MKKTSCSAVNNDAPAPRQFINDHDNISGDVPMELEVQVSEDEDDVPADAQVQHRTPGARRDITQSEFVIIRDRHSYNETQRILGGQVRTQKELGVDVNGRDVSEKSVSRIIKCDTWEEFRRRKGPIVGKPSAWTDDQLQDFIDAVISQWSLCTLNELVELADEKANLPRIAKSTLASYLEGQLITYHCGVRTPDRRNAPDVKALRAEHVRWLQDNFTRPFVYIDEMGFDLWKGQSRGRSRKGEMLFLPCSSQRGRNHSLIMAIGNNGMGVVHRVIVNDAVNSPMFSTFFGGLLNILRGRQAAIEFGSQQAAPELIIILLDNSRIHNRAELESMIVDGEGIVLKFLPPYSPMFNPIENIFGILRRRTNTLLREEGARARLQEIDRAAWGNRDAMRSELLRGLIVRASETITMEMFNNAHGHMASLFHKALTLQDL